MISSNEFFKRGITRIKYQVQLAIRLYWLTSFNLSKITEPALQFQLYCSIQLLGVVINEPKIQMIMTLKWTRRVKSQSLMSSG